MSRPDEPGEPPAPPRVRPDDPPWLTSRVELALYVAAAVTYVGFGMFHKFLLNWIIGPLFPVFVLYVVPTAVRALVRGRQR